MAGLGFCTALSCRRTTWLVLETNLAGNMPNKPLRKKSMVIRAEVDYVNAEEAKKLIAVDGYAVVDVRDKSQYDRAHIKSCYHVPLFIENKDNDLGTIINRTLHNNFSGLFYGLQFTKLNPTFVQSVKSQFSTDSKLLLVCQEGLRKGNLRFSEEHYSSSKPWLMVIERSMQGAVTAACISHDLRSAAASKKLEEAGFQNLSCITSGLQSVKPGTFDSVGSTELQNAGKAGLVTIQGKISAVLGTVLICAYLFITFFPEQAEKLLEMAPAS